MAARSKAMAAAAQGSTHGVWKRENPPESITLVGVDFNLRPEFVDNIGECLAERDRLTVRRGSGCEVQHRIPGSEAVNSNCNASLWKIRNLPEAFENEPLYFVRRQRAPLYRKQLRGELQFRLCRLLLNCRSEQFWEWPHHIDIGFGRGFLFMGRNDFEFEIIRRPG